MLNPNFTGEPEDAATQIYSEMISSHLWTVAFSVIMVISILGNSLVLWTVLAHRLQQ